MIWGSSGGFSVRSGNGGPNLTPPKYEPIRACMFATLSSPMPMQGRRTFDRGSDGNFPDVMQIVEVLPDGWRPIGDTVHGEQSLDDIEGTHRPNVIATAKIQSKAQLIATASCWKPMAMLWKSHGLHSKNFSPTSEARTHQRLLSRVRLPSRNGFFCMTKESQKLPAIRSTFLPCQIFESQNFSLRSYLLHVYCITASSGFGINMPWQTF